MSTTTGESAPLLAANHGNQYMGIETTPLELAIELDAPVQQPTSWINRWLGLFRTGPLLNLKSGVTVSLVNIPLSISLAIASGGQPVVGIISAFWSGLIAAVFGGSEFNIVGPTGALSGVLAQASSRYGQNALPYLAVMTGLVTLLVWALELAQYLMFVPCSVVHGFTFGVAFIIALTPMDTALGIHVNHTSTQFLEKTLESVEQIQHIDLTVFGFYLVNTVLLVSLARKWPKVPWAVIISVIGVIIGYMSKTGQLGAFHLVTLEDQYGNLNLRMFSFIPWDRNMFSMELFKSSFDVVFVAVLETLISARMADKLVKERGIEHDQQREVFGLGLANLIGGLFGGLPATAALARTVLNVRSEAVSRISAIMGSFSLLLLSFCFLEYFKFIPMATIAGLLALASSRMVDFKEVEHLYQFDLHGFSMFCFTFVICIGTDTMNGLLFGSIISLLAFASNMSHGGCEFHILNDKSPIGVVDLKKMMATQKDPDDPEEVGGPLASFVRVLHHGAKPASPSDRRSSIPALTDAALPLVDQQVLLHQHFRDQSQVLFYRLSGQLTYINAADHVHRIKRIVEHATNFKLMLISLRTLHHIDLDGVDALQEIIDIFKQKGINVRMVGLVNETVKGKLRHLEGVEFDHAAH